MKTSVIVSAFFAGLILSALYFAAAEWNEPEMPRLVAPRGELAPQEETVITLFEEARASVVSITTEERVLDPWTRSAHLWRAERLFS